MKLILCGLAVLSMAGCATSPPRLVNQEDAQVQFAKLGSGGRAIASQFYNLGAGDSIKRLYWAQRRAQESGATADAPPTVLQRKYVNIPVPAHIDPVTGVEIEASTRAVEIVQFWTVTHRHGRTLNIVR